MTKMMAITCRVAFVAAALAVVPVASAAPSAATPEMKRALEKAAQGPDELRRFVHRTRMIYGLDYSEVMSLHEARKAADAALHRDVASASRR